LGYAIFAISIFRREGASVAEVFYGFERFGKALGLYLLMTIFILLWLFPVYIAIPLAVVGFGESLSSLSYSFLYGKKLLVLLPLLALIVLCIPAYIAYFRYSMSYYILADNPDIGPLGAIRQSKRMMKGNKWKLLCMYLSFIGWYLLAICTFGIGFLWLMPYVAVTTIAFYDIAGGSLRAAGSAGGGGGGDWTPELPLIRRIDEEPKAESPEQRPDNEEPRF
jgi:uncharacterized membrane protein